MLAEKQGDLPGTLWPAGSGFAPHIRQPLSIDDCSRLATLTGWVGLVLSGADSAPDVRSGPELRDARREEYLEPLVIVLLCLGSEFERTCRPADILRG